VIFNNFVEALASSSLLLVYIVVFKWFEFSRSSSSTVMKTSLGPNFMAMVIEFNAQISQTLNPNLMFFFFQRLLQSFVHLFYQQDFVWLQKIVFCHGSISFLSEWSFKWFETCHIQRLEHM
jgi:hypothetical protein